jgi:succinate dehydrogenase / fumarate reductase, flavoprotein subunit
MQSASASGQRELELRYHRPDSDSGEGESIEALAPLKRDGGENLYDIQHDLQAAMQSLVGIVRNGPELEEALEKLDDPKERTAKVG